MKNLDEILLFDPLLEAEKVTGASYKDDDDTMKLGFSLMHYHAKRKNALLEEIDDTMLINELSDYVRKIEGFGFKKVLEVDFGGGNEKKEKLFIYHEEGLLLRFDTYFGNRVNSASVYYNWIPKDRSNIYKYTSSGGICDGVWVGNHDAREALLHKITNLRENGEILSTWKRRPFLRLSHYMEKDNDYESISAERISMLPDYVQDMIGESNG